MTVAGGAGAAPARFGTGVVVGMNRAAAGGRADGGGRGER